MPSSTSNSSERLPAAPGVRYLCLLFLSFSCLVVFSEGLWRERGFVPRISDTKSFWSLWRRAASGRRSKDTIVLVGASRSQFGLVPSSMEEVFPGKRVIHLAVSGSAPNEILIDLCTDESFCGTVLVSYNMSWFKGLLDGTSSGSEVVREYVQSYRADYRPVRFLDRRLNTDISARIQSALAICGPNLTLRRLVTTGLHPAHRPTTMEYTRYRPWWYKTKMTKEDLAKRRAKRIQMVKQENWEVAEEDFQKEMAVLSSLGQRLASRGGHLILVHMPMTDEHWECYEKLAPKAMYWDRIEGLSGVRTIHFRDYPELSEFRCPDTSHLDASDAPEFTRRLARIMRGKLVGDGGGARSDSAGRR